MIDDKHCAQCDLTKNKNMFGSHSCRKDGLRCTCKECEKTNDINRKRTKYGVISVIYSSQLSSSRHRQHSPPPYSRNDLKEWAFSQRVFHDLFDAWVSSGYEKRLKPSFDRSDDYLRYSLTRLKIVTWEKNNKKSHSDRKNGINNKGSISVIQMDLKGRLVAGHYSISSACRSVGVHRRNMHACLNGAYKSTGGYRWMVSLGIGIANNEN